MHNEIHTKPLNIQPKQAVLNKGICHPTLLLNVQQMSCPHCTRSLVAQEIPAEHRHNYLGMYCDLETGRYVPNVDDGRFMFYSHVIAQSSILHDRTLAYTCPFCNTTDVIPGLEELWDELQAWHESRDQAAREVRDGVVRIGQASLIASPLNHNMPESEAEVATEPRACA